MIGVIGLGRIGRHIIRELARLNIFEYVLIADLNNDLENLVYLLNYDSVYGLRDDIFSVGLNSEIVSDGSNTRFQFVDMQVLQQHGLDLKFVIDSTGASSVAKSLANQPYRVYVTNALTDQFVSRHIIAGTEANLLTSEDRVVSLSICDTTAIAPILLTVDRLSAINEGHITTLHPWLNYQNLSDGAVAMHSVPGQYFNNYSLGRKSSEALIAKSTTAVNALALVYPLLAKKLTSWSYRVPTPIVSSAVISMSVRSPVAKDYLIEKIVEDPNIVLSKPNLISCDHIGLDASCALDPKSINVNGHLLSMSIWYDNELGYVRQILKEILRNEIR